MTRDYIRDGAAIYAQSFATIRAETDLSGLSAAEARVAVRIVHAAGMTEIAQALRFSAGFTDAARTALRAGAPILCDAKMVAHGITRARLPADNAVICTLDDSAHAGPGTRNRQHPLRRRPRPLGRASGRRAGRHRQRTHRAVPPAGTTGRRRPPARRHHRPARRLRRCGGIQSGAMAGRPRALPGAARPAWRQRHDGGGDQRPGERHRMTGTLYSVGVGPGDPELLTLKAARILAAAPIHAFFAKRGRPSHARAIAAAHLRDERRGAALRLPLHHRNPARRSALRRADDSVLRASIGNNRRAARLRRNP